MKIKGKSVLWLSCHQHNNMVVNRWFPFCFLYTTTASTHDALWTAGGVVAFQPDCCGGSVPQSRLRCRDTFAPLHLCHEPAAAWGFSSRPLLPDAHSQVTQFFFCFFLHAISMGTDKASTLRSSHLSSSTKGRRSGSADKRCEQYRRRLKWGRDHLFHFTQ